MSLQTADDARRVISLLDAELTRLDEELRPLTPADWSGPSYCADWRVYQVVSHISSGAEILAGTVRHALGEGPPMDDPARRAIWARFDGLGPESMYDAFRQAIDGLLSLLRGLDDRQRTVQVPWFSSGTAPLARLLAARLNETTLHHWDLRVVREPAATLTPENLPDILTFNLDRIETLVRPERAPRLANALIEFRLTDPTATVSLAVRQGFPPGVATTPLPNPALVVETPAEAFLRLAWGRSGAPARPARLELSRPELQPDLLALFPGR